MPAKRQRITFYLAAVLLTLAAALPAAQPAPAHAQTLPQPQAQQVAAPFLAYYNRHEGIRVLGFPLSGLTTVQGFPAQYFEKGRIEDHRAETSDPTWQFAYGLLTQELMQRDPERSFSSTDKTYGDIRELANPALRVQPPAGYRGGTTPVHDGIFIPFDSALRPAPGYVVAPYFWAYMNRSELFPGGWLHDIGLPVTDTFNAKVVKNGEERTIFVQAFERTVLTYDLRNPAGWQVERGNIGADAFNTVPVTAGRIEIPAPNATVTLPLHILARGGTPGEQVTVTLRWADGVQFSHQFELLRGEDGRGLLVTNLDWLTEGPPPTPTTKSATLQIHTQAGGLLAEQNVTVLPYNDPGVQTVKLYWLIEEELVETLGRFPRTEAIGAATLEQLLWGPTPGNLADFHTAIPTPEQVLSYAGRGPDWGPRVTLKGLTISNGVATADFSKEMMAYGGGSARVAAISAQITQTLKQFPTVQEVRILVEGQPDMLQP
jgi:hypothetical protein